MTIAQYTAQILSAYEAELAGAAYFDALILVFPRQSEFLEKCAALERTTAQQLSALILKYQLSPRPQAALEERGVLDARMESGRDWKELMRHSIRSYAQYVADFRSIEARGPAEDQTILAALTAHEVQLIEWMQVEIVS